MSVKDKLYKLMPLRELYKGWCEASACERVQIVGGSAFLALGNALSFMNFEKQLLETDESFLHSPSQQQAFSVVGVNCCVDVAFVRYVRQSLLKRLWLARLEKLQELRGGGVDLESMVRRIEEEDDIFEESYSFSSLQRLLKLTD